MPKRKTVCEKSAMWNLAKPDGWKTFQELSDKAAEKIVEIVQDNTISIDDVIKKVDIIDNQIKFTAFGKTRVKTRRSIVEFDRYPV